jgi:hypothetical protein
METQFGKFGLLLSDDSNRSINVRSAKHSQYIRLNVGNKNTCKSGNHEKYGKNISIV